MRLSPEEEQTAKGNKKASLFFPLFRQPFVNFCLDFHESILRVSRETFLKKVTFETQKRSKIDFMQWSVFFLSKSEKAREKSEKSRILGRAERSKAD